MRRFRATAATAFPTVHTLPRGGLLLFAVIASIVISPALAGGAGGGISPGGSKGGPDKSLEPSSISGVSRKYAKFTAILASRTGISARVVAGWTLAEGGPKDNPLNMGPGNHYGTVRRGARATEKNLRSDLYRGIMRSVKKADMAQIAAIAASPWCPGCKGYRRLLRSTYRRVSVDE